MKGNRPFKVLSVTCDDKSFSFAAGKETRSVHVIPVTFAAGTKDGKLQNPSGLRPIWEKPVPRSRRMPKFRRQLLRIGK